MKAEMMRMMGKALKSLAKKNLSSPSRTGFFQPDVRKLKKQVRG